MTATTTKAVQRTDTVYDDLEFTKPADTLIEAVKQQLVRIDGLSPTAHQIKTIVSHIIDRRLA